MSIRGLEAEAFLERYWQREPLLLRQAVPDFEPPISADELAGLAMEEEAESRIIRESGGHWQLQQGPFESADYQAPGPWTLLVQGVDQWLPEVAALRQLVDFLPSWRVDDIMVSYASDGGSVGPHYDHYDVFLLQGEGERLWQLGQFCDEQTALLPGQSLRIVEHFELREEHLLGPGDILYVPPGLAHWGVAQGPCTTFSIGLRAPRQSQMLERWVDQRLSGLAADRFFNDAQREVATRAGEISAADIARAERQLKALLAEQQSPDWFGELVTDSPAQSPADSLAYDCDQATVDELIHKRALLSPVPGARIAWRQHASGIKVYANGQCCDCETSLQPTLEALCSGQDTAWPPGRHGRGLLHFLLEQGAIYVE